MKAKQKGKIMTLVESMQEVRDDWMKSTVDYAMKQVTICFLETQENNRTGRSFEIVLRQSANGEVFLGNEKVHLFQLPKEQDVKEEILQKFREQLEQEGISVNIDETIEITADSPALSETTVEIGSVSVKVSESK